MCPSRLHYQQIVRRLDDLAQTPGFVVDRFKTHTLISTSVKPQLLFVSGLHGDEQEVTLSLLELLPKYTHKLPPFWYIPFGSPSACQIGTRHNGAGLDLNRNFSVAEPDPETQVLQSIMAQHRFDKVVTFHQDNDIAQMYLYENSHQPLEELVNRWQETLTHHRFGLFTGIDDPEDPTLGNYIDNGFHHHQPTHHPSFEEWCFLQNKTNRSLCVEVGGHLSPDKKTEVVALTLQSLV